MQHSSIPFEPHPLDKHSFADIRQAIAADPVLGRSIRALLFPNDIAVKPANPIEPMPSTGIFAIEATIADNGQSKAKRQRPDRIGARWHVSIKAFDRTGQGLTDPCWQGFARMRSPERALKDAEKQSKPTLRYPFSPAYLERITVAADIATANGYLMGFLYSLPEDGGTAYHDGQLMLMTDPANGAPDHAVILHFGDGMTKIELPSFSTTTAKGNAFLHNYVFQSRACTSSDQYTGWATGKLVTTRR